MALRDDLAAVLGPGNDDAAAYAQADAVLEVLNADAVARSEAGETPWDDAVRRFMDRPPAEPWATILVARRRAHAKHGAQSIEALEAHDPRWLAILMEEVGEAAHELTYDATGSLRAELVDILSVASAWLDALDGRRLGTDG